MPRNITDHHLARWRNRNLGENIPVPPKPKRRNNAESREQQALVNWWRDYSKKANLPEHLLFAIPNGGRRDAITGAILKREGARAGAPDIMLAIPRGPYHGLFVEMKIDGGVVRDDQQAFIIDLISQGYCAGPAYGFQDARRFIEAYLAGHTFLQK